MLLLLLLLLDDVMRKKLKVYQVQLHQCLITLDNDCTIVVWCIRDKRCVLYSCGLPASEHVLHVIGSI